VHLCEPCEPSFDACEGGGVHGWNFPCMPFSLDAPLKSMAADVGDSRQRHAPHDIRERAAADYGKRIHTRKTLECVLRPRFELWRAKIVLDVHQGAVEIEHQNAPMFLDARVQFIEVREGVLHVSRARRVL